MMTDREKIYMERGMKGKTEHDDEQETRPMEQKRARNKEICKNQF
jgi:hypothetical protein